MTEPRQEEENQEVGLEFRLFIPNLQTMDGMGTDEQLVYQEARYDPSDLDNCKAETAAGMSYWNEKYGQAIMWVECAEARYRNWVATEFVLAMETASAEWKAKAVVESKREFLTHKASIAEAKRCEQLCKGAFESFKRNVDLLRTFDSMEKMEWNAAGNIARGTDKRSAPFSARKPMPTPEEMKEAMKRKVRQPKDGE